MLQATKRDCLKLEVMSKKWGLMKPTRQTFLFHLNPLRAKICSGNKNMYSNSKSLLYIDTAQVVEILPPVRQGPTYST